MRALQSRWLKLAGALVLASLICWFFPLFHVRRLGGESVRKAGEVSAEPRRAVSKELSSYASGKPVVELWDALDQDFTSAQQRLGLQSGLGGGWFFRVQGTGVIQSVEKNRLLLSIQASSRRVRLELGAVVDNTIRDSIGVKASQFLNSQEFNAFSAELNRQVEEDVIKPVQGLLVSGATVDFVGCVKIGSKSDLDPLTLVPIRLKLAGSASPSAANQTMDRKGAAP